VDEIIQLNKTVIPWFVLPLICCRLFFLLSFLLYFLTQKVPKTSALEKKSSQAPFAHAAIGEHSVGRLLATPGFRLFAGCCGP